MRNPSSVRLPVAALFCAFACVFAFFAAAFAPACAYAEPSYELPRTDIAAQVETDGSISVTELRTFAFSDDLSDAAAGEPLVWKFAGLAKEAKLQVSGVRMASVDSEGAVAGEWVTVPETAFSLPWREGRDLPTSSSYALDAPKASVYVFPFAAAGDRIVVELSYVIVNGVSAYKDTAELYWPFVGEQWSVPSYNVSATLKLPVPQGESVIFGQNVFAWGHGPADGTVLVDAAGAVAYRDDGVLADQYVTAHVLFPPSWLTHLSGKEALSHRSESRLEYALSEERGWADTWSWQQETLYAGLAALAVACALLLVTTGVVFWRVGREYAPNFSGKYWKELPEPGLAPGVAGRLWRWGHADVRDLAATVMRLAHAGAVRVEPVGGPLHATWRFSQVDAGAMGAFEPSGRAEGAARETRGALDASGALDGLDAAALDALFAKVAPAGAFEPADLPRLSARDPHGFLDAVEGWQRCLSEAVAKRGFFEEKGRRWQKRLLVLAGILAAGGVLALVAGGNFGAALILLPTAAVMALVANYLPRRTLAGVDLMARCKALKNWLHDLPAMEEWPQMDERAWGDLLALGWLFGVADKAVRAADAPQPPAWRAWYALVPAARGDVRRKPAADALAEALAEALQAAHDALEQEDAGSTTGGFGRRGRAERA